jgi:hypothetical protein
MINTDEQTAPSEAPAPEHPVETQAPPAEAFVEAVTVEEQTIPFETDPTSQSLADETMATAILNFTVSSKDSIKNFAQDIEEKSEFRIRKQEIEIMHGEYIKHHPELREFLADYMQLLLHRKPVDVYAFTNAYFKP